MTAPTRSRGGDPDQLAALEEEREFLLRSIEDLDRELAAGDIEPDDYEALKDDYTARAAAVLRRLRDKEASIQQAAAPRARSTIMWWLAGSAVVVVVLVFAISQMAGTRSSGDTATGDIRSSGDANLDEGIECLTKGEFDCAVEAFERAIEIDPGNTEALTALAVALERSGEPEEALDVLDEAIAADETFLDAWSVKVSILSELDRMDEAQAQIEQLTEEGGSDIAGAVAQQMAANGQAVEAVQVYDAVLNVEPDNAIALTYRGWLVSLADLNEEALVYLDRAVEADPTLPDAQAFRAVVLNRLGRTDEAREALEAFDALDPPEEMQMIIDAAGLREELEE